MKTKTRSTVECTKSLPNKALALLLSVCMVMSGLSILQGTIGRSAQAVDSVENQTLTENTNEPPVLEEIAIKDSTDDNSLGQPDEQTQDGDESQTLGYVKIAKGGKVAKIGDTEYSTLSAAVEAANGQNGATIEILEDIDLTSALPDIKKTMTIKSADESNVKTVTRAGDFKGAMLNVIKEDQGDKEDGNTNIGKLTLENIIFDGNKDSIAADWPILVIKSGTATLNSRAVLQNNKNVSGIGGAVEISSGGTFNMDGGTITGNTAADVSAVYIDYGTFNMKSGTISGNTNIYTYKSSLIRIRIGTFNMVEKLCEISGNSPDNIFGNVNYIHAMINGNLYSLSDAINAAAPGDTIEMISDVDLTETRTISKELTIKGKYNAPVTIKRAGDFKDAMFKVTAGGNLKLENIIFDGNSEAIEASAPILYIADDASATVKNVTLENNNNSQTRGGGVYVSDKGTLIVDQGKVLGNKASSADSKNGKGGGICSYGTLKINSGSISNNTATGHGGGICSYGSLEINNSVIVDNTTYSDGAGIYFYDKTSKALKMSGLMNFVNNKKMLGEVESFNDVYLQKNMTIALTGSLNFVTTIGAPAITTKAIGVTTNVSPVSGTPVTIVKGEGYDITNYDIAKFSSENASYDIEKSGNELQLVKSN